jgi:hypothetical protein
MSMSIGGDIASSGASMAAISGEFARLVFRMVADCRVREQIVGLDNRNPIAAYFLTGACATCGRDEYRRLV